MKDPEEYEITVTAVYKIIQENDGMDLASAASMMSNKIQNLTKPAAIIDIHARRMSPRAEVDDRCGLKLARKADRS